jgi:hypothetical protein
MRAAGVPVRGHKILGGWVAEEATRLKTGANFLTRSPLSDLTELETSTWASRAKLRAGAPCWARRRTTAC